MDINSELLPQLYLYGYYGGTGAAGPKNPNCTLSVQNCETSLPTDFSSMFLNTFNYSAPQYEVGVSLQINLRNRQVKADQFRAVLAYRQSQIAQEQQQKTPSLRHPRLTVRSRAGASPRGGRAKSTRSRAEHL